MNQSLTTIITISMLLILVSLTQLAHAQDDNQQQQQDYYDDDPTRSNFKPSIYVVVAVLSFMFSTTFLLLIYAKYCHHPPTAIHSVNNHQGEAMFGPNTRFSGLDKTVVESLPFFRFSTLKGSKQGLQCSVCLAEFEDMEILRLLPKCKHCFHIKCIDQWLESHSSCPLCRQKISPQDLAGSDIGSSSILELFVEREIDHGSSERSLGGSFRRFFRLRNEQETLVSDQKARKQEVLDGFKHQVVLISDIMFQNRWSNITSSDMLFLNSEMIGVMSSNRFSSSEEINVSNSADSSLNFNAGVDDSSKDKAITGDNRRSMSEITGVSRFKDATSMKHKLSNNDFVMEEIKKRKVWLSMVRRTVEWFVTNENNRIRSQQQQQSHVRHRISFV